MKVREIRKISSEDDVSGLPRSQRTPSIVSGYAESIRRQRSDSFVHSYNLQKISRTRPTPKILQIESASGDTEKYTTHGQRHCFDSTTSHHCGSLSSVKSTTNNTLPSKCTASSSTTSPLQINTAFNKTDTGSILEGVMIRRAVRPGSPLATNLSSSPQSSAPLNRSEASSSVATTTPLTPRSDISTSPIATSTISSTSSTPWSPPSLNASQYSNVTISSISLDTQGGGFKAQPPLSKSSLKAENSTDDQNTKHPSLFKRLAHFHQHRPHYDEKLHEFMAPSSSATVILNQDTELDRYGFQKATQWITLGVYHDFEKYYQPILDRRNLRWQQMMGENDSKLPDRSAQVKRYIRKGIPSHLRGRAWFHYSGAEAKMDANPGVYDKFLVRAQGMGNENEFADLIERDLYRTFPDNIQFSKAAAKLLSTTKSPPAIDVLRRVLSAFSVYCPSVGYCQSLNYLVGMLLLFLKEEEAFWCISTITQTILPAGVYDVTMEGASIDQAVLMMLLYERMPQLWYKMTDKTYWEAESDGVSMPTITLVTSHWFLTLFINILPTETVFRVWDCFFYEGSSILFRIALTLFKMSEPIICSLDDPLEIFQMIQNFPKRIIDCQMLMDNAFRRYGSLTDVTSEDLDRRREVCRELRKAKRTMTPNELEAARNRLDSTFRKRWKITTSTHHLGGSRK